VKGSPRPRVDDATGDDDERDERDDDATTGGR